MVAFRCYAEWIEGRQENFLGVVAGYVWEGISKRAYYFIHCTLTHSMEGPRITYFWLLW